MMNWDELKSRSVEDLRKLAGQYGIPTHHRQKAETIAKLIVEYVMNKPKTEELKQPEQPKKPDLYVNTEEEVRQACKDQFDKPGFLASFPGDDTATFRYKGAEECIHLSSSLTSIKVVARKVGRGAINPRGLKDNPLNPTANSGVIMMV
jgi:hypothetical protein